MTGPHDTDDHEPLANESLLPLAERIAAGAAIDRLAEEASSPADADQKVLDALLEIATIDAAHREAEASFERVWAGAASVPRQWGPLTILERIGRGESGDVYRAHHHSLALDVALKLAPATSDAEAERLLDEARRLARVRHPNVVRIHGAEHRHGHVGFWMDLVSGRTLEELAQGHGFSTEEAAQVGVALSRALAAVHGQGVLHGDIKASNVVRTDGNGTIVLIDFGAGRPLADEPAGDTDALGTPVYMAPEVIAGQRRSTSSDIYSLGVLLFYLVTRQYPIYASTRASFLAAHASGGRKRLPDLRPDLPPVFVDIIERATAGNPEARYASAGAFEAALIAFLGRTNGHSGRDEARARTAAAPWRRLIFPGAALLAVMAAIASCPDSRPSVAVISDHATAASDKSLPVDGYVIDAAFFRARDSGDDERLSQESTVIVDDRLHARITTSKPAYVYVVNEDDKGRSFLLFPLRDSKTSNLLPAGRTLRIPDNFDWQVDSPGGQEHFIVFASQDPVSALDDAFSRLASPRAPLPPELPNRLRSAGIVVPTKPTVAPTYNGHFSELFTAPLLDRQETAKGLWVRQLTVRSVRQ